MIYHVSFDIEFKKNPYSGRFIALEGIDGSGKTTQVKQLAKVLRTQGKTVFVTSNPTNKIFGKLLRKVLAGKIHIPSVSFQYIYTADRQMQQEEIIEHLKKGETVITDRYFWSAIAYGLRDKRGTYVNEDMLMAAHCILSMYHQQILPDYTFYLDVSIPTAWERITAQQREIDLYEKKEKLREIKTGYDWLAKKFGEEITVIDAENSSAGVTKQISEILEHAK